MLGGGASNQASASSASVGAGTPGARWHPRFARLGVRTAREKGVIFGAASKKDPFTPHALTRNPKLGAPGTKKCRTNETRGNSSGCAPLRSNGRTHSPAARNSTPFAQHEPCAARTPPTRPSTWPDPPSRLSPKSTKPGLRPARRPLRRNVHARALPKPRRRESRARRRRPAKRRRHRSQPLSPVAIVPPLGQRPPRSRHVPPRILRRLPPPANERLSQTWGRAGAAATGETRRTERRRDQSPRTPPATRDDDAHRRRMGLATQPTDRRRRGPAHADEEKRAKATGETHGRPDAEHATCRLRPAFDHARDGSARQRRGARHR